MQFLHQLADSKNALTNRRVQLHKPSSASRFLNKIIDANFFNNNRCEGIPFGVMEFRNYVGKFTAVVCSAESAL